MIEKIVVEGQLVALIVKKEFDAKSSTFISPEDLYMQVSIFKRESGFVEDPHYHKKILRKVDRVEQFMYLLEGTLKINFYRNDKTLFVSKIVKKGEALLIIKGIHGLEIVKTVKAISVKQGPFLGDINDKINVIPKK